MFFSTSFCKYVSFQDESLTWTPNITTALSLFEDFAFWMCALAACLQLLASALCSSLSIALDVRDALQEWIS